VPSWTLSFEGWDLARARLHLLADKQIEFLSFFIVFQFLVSTQLFLSIKQVLMGLAAKLILAEIATISATAFQEEAVALFYIPLK